MIAVLKLCQLMRINLLAFKVNLIFIMILLLLFIGKTHWLLVEMPVEKFVFGYFIIYLGY